MAKGRKRCAEPARVAAAEVSSCPTLGTRHICHQAVQLEKMQAYHESGKRCNRDRNANITGQKSPLGL